MLKHTRAHTHAQTLIVEHTRTHKQDQLSHCIHLYVEDQLVVNFPMLLGFVKKAEQQQKRLGIPEGQCIPHLGPQQAVPILKDFTARCVYVYEPACTVCTCVCVRACMRSCMWLCVCVCVCIHACVSACMCVWVSACAFACRCVCICVCMCVCVCVCVWACMCVFQL